MSNIEWTKEQQAAIDARRAKILVNAAAGSGKTAVLTTRITNRLIPENGETPVRADRLLVVTFTKAAASEMRARIEKGLKEALTKAAAEGDAARRRFISKQIRELQGAKICTIDSFCQSLVKEYFHVLNIDPGFRISQAAEEQQLHDEVLDRLFDRLFAEKDSAFMMLMNKCTKSGREEMIKDMVNSIYNFTSKIPYRTEFIEQSAEDYLLKDGFAATRWSAELYDAGELDSDDMKEFMRKVFYPQVKALCNLTVKFSDELEKEKHKKSVMSFSDIERMAYLLLAENEAVREDEKNRYDEILIDEYQDTNELQDGIFEMLTKGYNLFMVGDMKQSIYRFRGSEPLVFRSKSDTYSYDESSPMRKITLTKNYRSRNEVLLSINDLFESCMTRSVGELDYNEEEKLNLGNKDYIDTGCSYKSEFALLELDSSNEEALDRADSEAEYIAGRILEMKKSGFMVQDKNGVRPLENSDIVILMSSHKADGDIFVKTLSEYGIEASCKKRGYFERSEIRLIMSLLTVIDNAEKDIPMAAVMRSFVGGFSDDEIARIRINARDISLYSSLCDISAKYNLLKENGELSESGEIFGEKVSIFLANISQWRNKARYMSADRLVSVLFEETGFYAYFNKEEELGNIRFFFDKAKEFEQSGYRGVFAFLRHMERFAKSSEDFEGKSDDTGGDYVRIMTVHKSKGLEFPVVFLAGCGKGFDGRDAQGKLLMHQRLGISLDYIDYNDGIQIVSPTKKIFDTTIKNELLSERMRLLYVALTRAREKVIAVGTIKKTSKIQDTLDDWAGMKADDIKQTAGSAKCFADWLAPVSMNSDNWEFTYVKGIVQGERPKTEKKGEVYVLPDADKIRKIANYTYEFDAMSMKSKAAVSDFKGISHTDMPAKPNFLEDKKISGADFGTAVHKIMETLPRDRGEDREYIKAHIKELTDSGEIICGISEEIAADKIVGFFLSELGQRFQNAENIHTESEFEIAIDAKELFGADGLAGEKILLQGVIDCWFEEEEGIVLVDYKTDRVRSLDEIHQKYDVQLGLYAHALEKIAKKRVKDKFIYLFSEECVIQC